MSASMKLKIYIFMIYKYRHDYFITLHKPILIYDHTEIE